MLKRHLFLRYIISIVIIDLLNLVNVTVALYENAESDCFTLASAWCYGDSSVCSRWLPVRLIPDWWLNFRNELLERMSCLNFDFKFNFKLQKRVIRMYVKFNFKLFIILAKC